MPNTKKCRDCRSSKKGCSRDGGDWNEGDPQTRCSRCKALDLFCGPDEYKNEDDQGNREVILGMGQRAGAASNRGVQPLAPAPYTEAYLRERLRELANSDSFCTTQQNITSLQHVDQSFTVGEDLSRALEYIEELAGQAYASNDLSIAELAFMTLIEWYDDLGRLEFNQRREGLLMKMGGIFEATKWKDRAEKYSLKIFDYLLVDPRDKKAPFHHAIRNVKNHSRVGRDALMRIIRCCPLCRFKLRNQDRHTPLLLAVSIQEEEVVVAMIKRLREARRQGSIQEHLDARDPEGITILTHAVLAWCSLRLIDALIQCGSAVNPQTLPGGSLTPLQAASCPGYERPDVAWLLLQHRANPSDVHPGSEIAILLAEGRLPKPAYVSLLPELDQQP